eukprot:1021051-Rhodomonas_salina.2
MAASARVTMAAWRAPTACRISSSVPAATPILPPPPPLNRRALSGRGSWALNIKPLPACWSLKLHT